MGKRKKRAKGIVMSITVSGQSQYLYQAYSIASDDTCQQYAVDSDTMSEEKYNISDLSKALDTLEQASCISYDSVGNLTNYVNSAYSAGQLGLYDSSGTMASLLNGESSSDNIYDLIAYCNTLSQEELISLTGVESSSVSSYTDYLDDNDILDILA